MMLQKTVRYLLVVENNDLSKPSGIVTPLDFTRHQEYNKDGVKKRCHREIIRILYMAIVIGINQKDIARNYRLLLFKLDLKIPRINPFRCVSKISNNIATVANYILLSYECVYPSCNRLPYNHPTLVFESAKTINEEDH